MNAITRRRGRWHPAIPREIEQRAWEHGGTVPELCEALGISPALHYRWMADHPAYARAVRAIRARHCEVIEAALIRRAQGYEYVVEEVTETEREVVAGDGQIVTLRDVRRQRKPIHVPPDVSAQKFYLTNRNPERWSEKTSVEVTTPYAALVENALRRLEEIDGRTLDGVITTAEDAETIEDAADADADADADDDADADAEDDR